MTESVQPDASAVPALLNRERAILEFNRRVLAQASRADVPLLERLRYVCIVSSNMDEFFEVRFADYLEAARRLGSQGEVIFLQQVDGDLADTRELRSEIARHIRRLKPQVVLGHDPWKRYRLHPDHRHAGFLTCDAVVASRDPHFFKEHAIAHHRPQHLLLWEADEPDHGEDIGGFVEQKIASLLAHESQFESTMKAIDQTALDNFSERMCQRMIALGQRIDRPAAEIFKKISDI